MEVKEDIYTKITNMMLGALDGGLIPWRQPWRTNGLGYPQNAVTKRPYTGANPFSLWYIAEKNGYPCAEWLTFKQAKALGGTVRKGEKGTPVYFWMIRDVENKKTKTPERVPFAKAYTVFNVAQCDGLPLDKLGISTEPVEALNDGLPLADAQALWDNYKEAPTLEHIKERAFYSPLRDALNMPKMELFADKQEYYSTLYHEMTHSTGHESRLKRFDDPSSMQFGSNVYSKEELIAEMGSAFMCARVGIDSPDVVTNQKAYIQGWASKLRSDKRLIISAAAHAQKAVAFITK